MAPFEKLAAAARVLARGGSVADAARASGLRRESISRRLHDPKPKGKEFRALVERYRREQGDPLAEHRLAAQEVLADALAGDAPPATRVRAALEVLRAAPPEAAASVAAPAGPSTAESFTQDAACSKLATACRVLAGSLARGKTTPTAAVRAELEAAALALAMAATEPGRDHPLDTGEPLVTQPPPTAEPPPTPQPMPKNVVRFPAGARGVDPATGVPVW